MRLVDTQTGRGGRQASWPTGARQGGIDRLLEAATTSRLRGGRQSARRVPRAPSDAECRLVRDSLDHPKVTRGSRRAPAATRGPRNCLHQHFPGGFDLSVYAHPCLVIWANHQAGQSGSRSKPARGDRSRPAKQRPRTASARRAQGVTGAAPAAWPTARARRKVDPIGNVSFAGTAYNVGRAWAGQLSRCSPRTVFCTSSRTTRWCGDMRSGTTSARKLRPSGTGAASACAPPSLAADRSDAAARRLSRMPARGARATISG